MKYSLGIVYRQYFLLALSLGVAHCATPANAQPRGRENTRQNAMAHNGCEVPDVVTEGRLRQDVTWLADDAREGREPGTAGGEATLRFLTAELTRLGIQPGGTEGFLQRFEAGYGHETDPAAVVTFTRGRETHALRAGRDFAVVGGPYTGLGEAVGRVFFAGHALVTREGRWDDFRSGPSVRGGVVVALSGAPRAVDRARAERLQRANVVGSIAGKARAARENGAVALVVIETGPGAVGERYSPAPEGGIPVVMVTQEVGRWILGRDPGVMGEESGVTVVGETTVRVVAATRARSVRTANVIATVVGSDPAVNTGVLLLGAHQDHIGHGARTSRWPGSTEVHNGADDNASGTAAVLELARRVRTRPLRHSVTFVWFGAEELGLVGSQYLAAHPTGAVVNTRAMWNFDMVGRLRGCRLYLERDRASGRFEQTLAGVNARWGFDARPWNPRQGSWGASDHMSFAAMGVPTIFFFTGLHGEYHGPRDDSPTLNYRGEASVISLAEALARTWDADPTAVDLGPAPTAHSR